MPLDTITFEEWVTRRKGQVDIKFLILRFDRLGILETIKNVAPRLYEPLKHVYLSQEITPEIRNSVDEKHYVELSDDVRKSLPETVMSMFPEHRARIMAGDIDSEVRKYFLQAKKEKLVEDYLSDLIADILQDNGFPFENWLKTYISFYQKGDNRIEKYARRLLGFYILSYFINKFPYNGITPK